MIRKLEKAVVLVSNVALFISMALLVGIMFFTTADVTGRFFGHPITGSYQLSELVLVLIVCLAWPYTAGVKGHVRVEVFISKLSPRTQERIGLLTQLVALCLFLVIAWQGIGMILMSIRMNELVSIIGIPLYPFKVIVPLGAFLVCPVLLIQIIQLVTGRKKEGG
jgi:TRAP-type C4-dicarboxylate transport system permease small subunit